VALLLPLASCATTATTVPTIDDGAAKIEARQQAEYVIGRRRAEQERVYAVAQRLRAANVDLCPRKAGWIGVTAETQYDFGKDFRPAASTVLGVGETPMVTLLAKGGPAERAGLRIGDVITQINGQPVLTGAKGSRDVARKLRVPPEQPEVRILVDRGGMPVEIVAAPQSICAYEISVVDGNDANAYADGDDVFIYRGMLKLVETDDELALVLGHELAHDAMGHNQKQRKNQTIGMVGGALLDIAAAAGGANTNGQFTKMGGQMGARAYSQEFEAEADYVGVYFMVRAGYNPVGVEQVWRRMAAENPSAINMGLSHPTTPARYLTITRTRSEVQAKQASGQPLTPTLKPAQ
jgi:Zn-dependent protease with chaperone function